MMHEAQENFFETRRCSNVTRYVFGAFGDEFLIAQVSPDESDDATREIPHEHGQEEWVF